MRNTKQRELILNIINNSYNHPSAYDIYLECKKIIPNISLGTVYRNLNTLIETNSIQKIKTTDNKIQINFFIILSSLGVIVLHNVT